MTAFQLSKGQMHIHWSNGSSLLLHVIEGRADLEGIGCPWHLLWMETVYWHVED